MNELMKPDAINMILDIGTAEAVERFAGIMSSGAVTVPEFLQGKKADCLAIVMQSMAWGLNPFQVAQCTSLVRGKLMYESKLVHAVISSSGEISSRIRYKEIGDWNLIAINPPKCEDKGKNPKWPASVEAALGVTISATLAGDSAPTCMDFYLWQAYPRISTRWARDPYAMLCYQGLRRFARHHLPDSIMGISTPDEREEIDMGPATVVGGDGEFVEPDVKPKRRRTRKKKLSAADQALQDKAVEDGHSVQLEANQRTVDELRKRMSETTSVDEMEELLKESEKRLEVVADDLALPLMDEMKKAYSSLKVTKVNEESMIELFSTKVDSACTQQHMGQIYAEASRALKNVSSSLQKEFWAKYSDKQEKINSQTTPGRTVPDESLRETINKTAASVSANSAKTVKVADDEGAVDAANVGFQEIFDKAIGKLAEVANIHDLKRVYSYASVALGTAPEQLKKDFLARYGEAMKKVQGDQPKAPGRQFENGKAKVDG